MAEYSSMFVVSVLASILFFGGWNGPLPITHWLGLAEGTNPVLLPLAGGIQWLVNSMSGFVFGKAWISNPSSILIYVANLLGLLNVLFKGLVGVTFMMWVRWTLPRLRIDQVMTTCLKYCTPLAAIMFVGATVWKFYGVPFINDIAPMQRPGEVREYWLATEPANTTAPQSNADDAKLTAVSVSTSTSSMASQEAHK